MRTGIGYDLHKFETNAELSLRLGGIDIHESRRLLGHSDGDALIHAVVDAILGAAAAGDIGSHFPSDDPATEGIDSRELLRRVQRLVTADGFSIVNIDVTVIAETPRLGDYLGLMCESLATALEIQKNQVNVKATTNEQVGSLGSGEAIAVMAIASLTETVE
ncbi:MAG: 2-C-methyl-D-erythritol 2,4-cyclodiphosphate synthase [Chloroflexota bacterium]|nr:2-C-methyl-D-erythritol 2,4-cyclodiphosphate synthase [Chloroflexota bacterium]